MLKVLSFGNKKRLVLTAVFLLLAIFSFIVFQKFKGESYPQIGIDVKIDRHEAKRIAENFLKENGVPVERYKNVTEFFGLPAVENYLDRSIGSQKAGELLNEEIVDWQFQTRFFIPLEQEEYFVSFDNLGRFSSYQHVIPNEKEGAKLSVEDAKKIAEDFFVKHYHENLADYSLVEKDVNDRGWRIDYGFTWEKNGFDVGGAKKRISINILGDWVGSFYEFLNIPEEWQRNEMATYAKNGTMQTVASVATNLLIFVPMIAIFMLNFKKKNFNYKLSLKIALAVIVVSILSFVCSLPSMYSSYNTLDTWSSFVLSFAFFAFLGIILSGLEPWFLVMAAEPFFRENNPEKQSMGGVLTKKFFFDSRIGTALFYGFFSGIIVAAYQVVYYLMVKKLGFWVPAEVSSGGIFSGLIPWVYVLAAGLLPAISEEITFRLFGITFLKKIFKKVWLAVLISSLLWAFLHSSYPQQPFFARGLELLPVGILFSVLYLRYGIVASITAHFTLNSFLTLQFLLKGGMIDKSLSVLIFVAPLILFFINLILSKRTAGLVRLDSNIDFSTKPVVIKKEKLREGPSLMSFGPISKKFKIFAFCVIVVAFSVWIYSFFSPFSDNSFLPTPDKGLPRKEIITLADRYLADKGIDTSKYMKTVDYYANFGDEDKDYLFDQDASGEKLKAVYDKKIPAFLWSVNYFIPMEKERYIVTLLPSGALYDLSHIIPEEQKGASLSKDEAQRLAEDNLRGRSDVDISNLELVQIVEEKRPERMDYVVVFKEKDIDLGEGSVRIDLSIKGDSADGFYRYIYIPESWYRSESKFGAKDFIVVAVLTVGLLVYLFYFFFSFLKLFRSGAIDWRRGFVWALPVALLSVAMIINSLAYNYYASYNGIESLSLFHVKTMLAFWFGIVGAFFLLSSGFSYAFALIRENITERILPQTREERLKVFADAGIIAYAFWALFLIVTFFVYGIGSFLEKKYLLYKYVEQLASSENLNLVLPFFATVGDNLAAMLSVPLTFLPLLVLYRLFKRWRFVGLALLCVISLGFIVIDDIKKIAVYSFFLLSITALVVLFCAMVKKNLLSIPIVAYLLILFLNYDFYSFNSIGVFGKIAFVVLLLVPVLAYLIYRFYPIIKSKIGRR
jgi:membrane protease YdiL (CAAX protease family)